MKKIKSFITAIALLFLLACKEESNIGEKSEISYDIIPVIGQSNTYHGLGLDYAIDKTDNRIKQLGRFDTNGYKIIPAKDPLEHFAVAQNCNGFAMTFALNYLQNYWKSDKEVLLIPGAMGGSSFYNQQWRKGDTLYNDILKRVRYVLEKYPGSEVKAILWHQGETDVYFGRSYGQLQDITITDLRKDIAGVRGNSIPFIVGGLVPYWADLSNDRKIIDSVIAETPLRLPKTGYASARLPFVLSKPDNTIDEIHFDAAGQRELGKRYFNEYKKLRD